MYDSFTNYDYIFIDYNDYIYKLNPKIVKNNMIDVIRLDKNIFIKDLQNNTFNIKKEIIKQSNLYIKQQGAGNGKTFGLIQNLKTKNFSHYDFFIIVSKQHSAKTIIYNEFINQLNNGNLNELELINNDKEHYLDKKYQISFRNKITNKISHILISTIDSFMYKLGDKKEVRRFSQFNDAFENYKNVSQSGEENQYNIDLAKDEYVYNEYINCINTLWITYKF